MDLQVAKPITLPCGLTLPNRLVKAALAEAWGDNDHLPTDDLIDTYGLWADGGWGAVLTGNVMIDVNHLSTPEDTALNNTISRELFLARWKRWAEAASRHGTPTLVQINHPGRQAIGWAGHQGFFGKPIAPSAIPLELGRSGPLSRLTAALMFGTPRAMTRDEIASVVAGFAEAARLSAEAGFAGAEIHAAHGYLLSQFLSETSNQRTDEYGGSPRKRARIIVQVIEAMRAAVPAAFCIGIKLNSADHQSQRELAHRIEQLEEITAAGVDFIEISGGTYSKPTMVMEGPEKSAKSASTLAREAFFLDFALAIRNRFRDVPLILTGGFRTRQGMEAALREGACDIIGVGRPAVLHGSLAKDVILNPAVKDADAVLYARALQTPWIAKTLGLTAVTGGAEVVWYQEQLHNMLQGIASNARVTTLGKLFNWFLGV